MAGRADPNTEVRLITPQEEVISTLVDPSGNWRVRLVGADAVRLFGVSDISKGRRVQAEGYMAVLPGGTVMQLRAGAGARVIDDGREPSVLTVDYDRRGGVVVAGFARPETTILIEADGKSRGHMTADVTGRFTIPFDEPLSNGSHLILVESSVMKSRVDVNIAPPAPLGNRPFRATQMSNGWRVDWLTPGGGVQSTLLVAQGAPSE